MSLLPDLNKLGMDAVSTEEDIEMSNDELIQTRYPKRKRAEVKYVPSDSEDDWFSEEEEYDSQPQKKVKQAPKKLPKHKIFPFMLLPAELRNKVYSYALSDDDGIFVTSKTKGYRRLARRCIQTECQPQFSSRYSRFYRNFDGSDDGKEPRLRNSFVPNLLAVSKEIYAEAASFLYTQPIVVADNYALLALLNQIGPNHIKLLRDISIREWCGGRAHKSINFPAITMLTPATELRRFNVACQVGYFGSYGWRGGKTQEIAHRVARKIFRDCYPFLEAYGKAKGDVTAGVDIVEISEKNFGWSKDAEKELPVFKDELRRLLRT